MHKGFFGLLVKETFFVENDIFIGKYFCCIV